MRTLFACLLAAASFGVAAPATAEFANNEWCVVHDGHYHCPDVCLREGGSLVGCNDEPPRAYLICRLEQECEIIEFE